MSQPTVIIADDDSALVQALALRGKEMGLEVFCSPDAMHALLATHRLKPDLIMLDINMPGGNGLSVCEMLAADKSFANIPVIIMTGESGEAVIERCEALGAHYVRKSPHLWEDLQRLICRLLNLAPPTIEAVPKPAERETSTLAEQSPPRRPKVLCIDDDPEITQVIKIRLECYGVSVLRAFSGMQGFWTALDCRPQVIICDMNMPDGEGNYVNGRLKAHPITKDIPVIILTGQANPGLKRQMFCSGVSAYLPKPLVFEDLLGELRKHLDLSRHPISTQTSGPASVTMPADGVDNAAKGN